MMREPGSSGKRRKYEGGLTVPPVPWARYVCATSSTVSGSLPTRTSRTCPWGITANSGLRSDVKRKTVSFVVIHVRRHRTPQDVHTPRPGWHAQRTLATGWSLGSLSTRAGLRPADTARRLAGRRTAQGARRWRLLHRSRCSAHSRAASCDRAGVGDRERLPYGVGGPCAPRRRHARSLIQIVPHSAWRRVVRCSHLVALQTDGALRPRLRRPLATSVYHERALVDQRGHGSTGRRARDCPACGAEMRRAGRRCRDRGADGGRG